MVLVLSVDKNESVPDVGFGARSIRFMAELGPNRNIMHTILHLQKPIMTMDCPVL